MKEHIAKEKAKYDKKCKREKAVEEKRQLTLLYQSKICNNREKKTCTMNELKAEQKRSMKSDATLIVKQGKVLIEGKKI